MEDEVQRGKRKAGEGEQDETQNETTDKKRARIDHEARESRASKGKEKDDSEGHAAHSGGPAEDGTADGTPDDEARAMELEKQREEEEEDKRAARKAASRFQQSFREDAEFGQLDYTNISTAARGSGNEDGLEGEEEARGEASLADEQAGRGYILQGKEVPIEPFNLKEDRDLGYFDSSGNFIFTRRDRDGEDDDIGDEMNQLAKEHRADAQQADAWLRDSETLATTRSVPSRAPQAAAPMEEVPVDLLELKRRVCEVLLPEETVQQALRRLGQTIKLARAAQAKAKGKGKGNKRPKGKATTSATVEEDPAEDAVSAKATEHLEESRRKLDLVTDAASKLFDDGWVNVYEYTRERILSTLLDTNDSKPQQSLLGYSSGRSDGGKPHGGSARSTSPEREEGGQQPEEVMWEYKQSEEGELYGPFGTEQMAAWYDEGFFRGESLALVRRMGESDFVRSDTVDFHKELRNGAEAQ